MDGLDSYSSPINTHFRPHLVEVQKILLKEDQNILLLENKTQLQNIGECMEYALNHKVFADLVQFSKDNTPKDMFIICIEFLTTLCRSIKAVPLMHNNRVHAQLVKALQQMGNLIRSNDGKVRDEKGNIEELYVKTILEFVEMITDHALDKDREIVKFYAQSKY